MLESGTQIELPEDVFHLFRDIVYENSGVVIDEDGKYFVQNRLQHSIRRRKIGNFRDYYHFLKYDRNREDELASVIDLLTIHETYFFREERQLKALAKEVIPELIKQKNGNQTIRIWSAGCSTGEEPYTLSMIFHEVEELKDWNIEIIGTDISPRVLHSARRGLYQPSAFRTTDARYITKYFMKNSDGYRIVDDIRKNVIFLHMNLLDENKLALINPMDMVFCRNVIIYFDSIAKREVIDTFHRKLNPGGYLFLGHSESLMNISTAFALRHFMYDMLYQKADGSRVAL